MQTVPIWEIHALSNEVERRCARQGLQVQFSKETHTAYTNAEGDVVFPALKMPMTKEQLIKLKHYMIHEPIHQTRPECFAIAKRENLDMKSPLGAIFNILEDNIMEHEWSDLWLGDRSDIAAGTALHDLKWVSGLDSSQELKGDTHIIYAAILLAKLGRMSWDNVGVSLTPTLISKFDSVAPEVSALVRNHATKWTPILSNVYETEQVYEYAVELYNDLLEGNEPEDTSEEAVQEAMSNGSATSQHDEEQEQEEQSNSAGEDEADEQGEEVQFLNGLKMKTLELEDYGEKDTYHCKTIVTSSHNANKIRKALQVVTRSQLNTERKQGKIHNSNLSRIAQPLIGDGDWNSRIFKNNRKLKENLNTCVTVLVDCSGSMSGSKINIASAVSQEVMNTLKELRVPCEVLAFGCCSHFANNGVLKNFREKINPETLRNRFSGFFSATGGTNHDADAIMWATQRSLARKEKRKILIVLSDGAPSTAAAGGYSAPDQLLKQVLGDLIKRPVIDVYGIGIEDAEVRRYYGDKAQVVRDATKLGSVVLNTLKEGLLK